MMSEAPPLNEFFSTWFPNGEPSEAIKNAQPEQEAFEQQTVPPEPVDIPDYSDQIEEDDWNTTQGQIEEDLKNEGVYYPPSDEKGNFEATVFESDVLEDDWAEKLKPEDFQQGKEKVEQESQKIDDELEEKWLAGFESGDDILNNARVQPWLIKSKLPTAGAAQIYGPSTSGKTLLAVDLALSLATGVRNTSLGMTNPRDVQGPQYVVYVALEGGAVHDNYIRAWLMEHDEPEVHENYRKYFIRRDGSKGNLVQMSVDAKRLAMSQYDYDAFMQFGIDGLTKRGKKPALVVFDTQRYLMGMADENSNTDLAKLYTTLKTDGDKRGILMMCVHHSGKDTTKGAVGASSPFTICDSVIEVKASDTLARRFEWLKCKGQEAGISGQAFLQLFRDPLDVKTEWDDASWEQSTIACARPHDPSHPGDIAQFAVSVPDDFIRGVLAVTTKTTLPVSQTLLVEAGGYKGRKFKEGKDFLKTMLADGYLVKTEDDKYLRGPKQYF